MIRGLPIEQHSPPIPTSDHFAFPPESMFGFINCLKPVGYSSRDAVNVVQGRLRKRKIKVGHCGTLDPLADGVLVIAVGPAARLVPFVHETSKEYVARFELASESPTGDLEVTPTRHPDHPRPTADQLAKACRRLIGDIRQTPPAYSAVKVDGRRAYDLARQGRPVDIPSRTVRIHQLDVVQYDYPHVECKIVCGTGTYIRSLGIDLARSLGTVAVMTALTRTRVGQFTLSDAVTIDRIRQSEPESLLWPAANGVAHLPQRRIDSAESQRLGNGLCLEDPPTDSNRIAADDTHAAAITPGGHLRAILRRKGDRWCPKRVFPEQPTD